jgi:MGT family glycosyltransferase
VFFNVPLHGHVNPGLDLVDSLVKTGHKVIYYTSEGFREKIQAIGADFRSYGAVEFTLTRDISNIFHTAREMLEAAEKIMAAIHPVLKKDRIDLILYDVSAVWGKFFGKVFKVPSVCCFPGFAPQWKGYIKSKTIITRGIMDSVEGFGDMRETRVVRDRIVTKYGITKTTSSQLFGGSKILNILFTSPYLQPYSENLKNFIFIAPILKARVESISFPFEALHRSNTLIYISMGTLYKPTIEFFKTCLETFRNEHSKYDVIISIGKGTNIEDIGPCPDHIFIRPYVPQLQVLERAKVFVSHGGMGGINESMFYGVPMLILPKTIEQQVNARRMDELGAGIDLKTQDVTPDQLLTGVEKLLSTNSYVKATKKISKSFEETQKGLECAIKAIEGLSYVGDEDDLDMT